MIKQLLKLKKKLNLKKSKEAEETLARKKAEEAKLAAEKQNGTQRLQKPNMLKIERKMAEKAEAAASS